MQACRWVPQSSTYKCAQFVRRAVVHAYGGPSAKGDVLLPCSPWRWHMRTSPTTLCSSPPGTPRLVWHAASAQAFSCGEHSIVWRLERPRHQHASSIVQAELQHTYFGAVHMSMALCCQLMRLILKADIAACCLQDGD